jgi:hypothetical protein
VVVMKKNIYIYIVEIRERWIVDYVPFSSM